MDRSQPTVQAYVESHVPAFCGFSRAPLKEQREVVNRVSYPILVAKYPGKPAPQVPAPDVSLPSIAGMVVLPDRGPVEQGIHHTTYCRGPLPPIRSVGILPPDRQGYEELYRFIAHSYKKLPRLAPKPAQRPKRARSSDTSATWNQKRKAHKRQKTGSATKA